MASDPSFKNLKHHISQALIDTTRTASQISNEDLAFQRSSNPSFGHLLEQQNTRLLGLARRLTRCAASGSGVVDPHITDADSVEDHWKEIVDVVDNLLEKADACLDEYSGVIRASKTTQEEQTNKAATTAAKQKSGKAHRTQNIAKPQLLFDNIPKNDETTPFKPSLRTKPNAVVALEESLNLVATADGTQHYDHPYETEIKTSQYPAAARVKADPIPFLPYESSEATLVDTPESLLSMLDELRLAKDFAVDVEHHDEHSYAGLVSLMQISTRTKDWVIDTLKPWREKLQVLNEVFTDPKIVKVFHGSSMDMIWLQRDFGLYVVGLFDTFHASRLLGYPKHGLAYLLKRFANFDAAKQYQTADWRIRPLPAEMFNYARSDTHFLLYIYDNLRNELLDRSNITQEGGDLIEVVLDRSKEEALQRYERPFYDIQRGSGPMGWYNMLSRTPALFNKEQFAVFRAVHQWRDQVAREEDESVHVIMPKYVLYNIARELPVDMPSLLGASHPISRDFQTRKLEILAVIKRARMLSDKEPEMQEIMHSMQPMNADYFSKPHGTGQALSGRAIAKIGVPSLLQLNSNMIPAQKRNSGFWGSTVRNAMDRGVIGHVPREKLNLALPMPRLTAEIFEDSKPADANANRRPQISPRARVEHQYIKPKASEIFISREAEIPLKRKASDTCHPPNTTDSRSETNAMDHTQEHGGEIDRPTRVENQEQQERNTKFLIGIREEKRAHRLEGKRLKKEESHDNQNVESQRLGEVEPFEYAHAPSVLHSRGNSNRMIAVKEINPYTKSSNAPKGSRKAKSEQEGKSLTFRG